jgi:hypothetical protein
MGPQGVLPGCAAAVSERHRRSTDRATTRCPDAGPWQAEVAKRIDIYAAALFHEMTVDAINDLDLSYTPPFGSPWDTVHIAVQDWERSRAKK